MYFDSREETIQGRKLFAEIQYLQVYIKIQFFGDISGAVSDKWPRAFQRHNQIMTLEYPISSYSRRGTYSFLNSSSEETIQVFVSLM